MLHASNARPFWIHRRYEPKIGTVGKGWNMLIQGNLAKPDNCSRSSFPCHVTPPFLPHLFDVLGQAKTDGTVR
jgi:hypothetical protein